MATPAVTSTSIVATTRQELAESLFQKIFEGVLEQAAMTPEQTEALSSYIGTQEAPPEILQRRDDLVIFYHRWLAEAKLRREEAAFLEKQARAIEAVAERVPQCVKLQMEMWGVSVIEGARHRFKLQKSPKPRVLIENESLIPTEFLEYKPVPNKERIREALEANQEVPGCKLEQNATFIKIS